MEHIICNYFRSNIPYLNRIEIRLRSKTLEVIEFYFIYLDTLAILDLNIIDMESMRMLGGPDPEAGSKSNKSNSPIILVKQGPVDANLAVPLFSLK